MDPFGGLVNCGSLCGSYEVVILSNILSCREVLLHYRIVLHFYGNISKPSSRCLSFLVLWCAFSCTHFYLLFVLYIPRQSCQKLALKIWKPVCESIKQIPIHHWQRKLFSCLFTHHKESDTHTHPWTHALVQRLSHQPSPPLYNKTPPKSCWPVQEQLSQ